MARLSRARAPLKLFSYPNYSIVLVHSIGVLLVNSFVVTSLRNHVTLRMSNEILQEVLTFEGVVCGNVIWMLFFFIYKGKFSFFVEFGLTSVNYLFAESNNANSSDW